MRLGESTSAARFAWLDDVSDDQRAAGRIRGELSRLASGRRRPAMRAALATLASGRTRLGVALHLLAEVGDPAVLDDLAQALRPLPGLLTDDEEAHLADLVRVLAAAGDPQHVRIASAYLLDRPIGPAWVTVPWALWPRRRSLFARAWARYFRETEPARWRDAAFLSTFLVTPRSVRWVRERLEPRDPARWTLLRDALRRHADEALWLTRSQRGELERRIA